MTIDSSWIACLKEEAPCAFTPHPPFRPDAVFVDGQIRLMCPTVDGLVTWADYIERQFERHLARYLERGVACVILAFDDYAHVPAAKAMTQARRRRHAAPVAFGAREPLPSVVPRGDQWQRSISNRAFKGRVIRLVIDHLVRHLRLREGQSLVVDYQGPPVRYLPGGASEPLEGMAGLGEADVKFCRYAALYERLQVDSVDGDSLPIALLHLERGGPGDISILRLETRLAGAAKRVAPAGGPRRVYEYVHVNAVLEALRGLVVPQCVDRTPMPSHAGHEVAMLVCLIGLTGTDFTRGLPLLSGKAVYEQLPHLWVRLASAFDPAARALAPDAALDRVVAVLYQRKFERHARPGGLDAVLGALGGSKLSERTRAHLPTRAALHCNVRNINWLLRYWEGPGYPDPVQPQYGYVRDAGGVRHAD